MIGVAKPAMLSGLVCLAISCSSGTGNAGAPPPGLPKSGVIHEKVIAAQGRGLTYALYIPVSQAKETGSDRFPVVIALDPMGSGLLPVKKYRDLAEKYGYILAGSNDSRNGQPAGEIDRIVGGMLDEMKSVYPVDTARIYLAGFSGGARVSCLAGMFYPEVQGVIGCGAGFPSAGRQPLYKFDYFGIAGTADFNLNEMLRLDSELDRAGYRHFITTHPGRHVWPPAAIMEEGFQWITLNAMRDGMIARDTTLVGSILSGLRHRIDSLREQDDLIAAAGRYREAISFAGQLVPVTDYTRELADLEQIPEYKNLISEQAKVMKKEETEQKQLMDAMFTMDADWWKKRIARLDPPRKAKMNPAETLMYARLRGFLSLMCYSDANNAMREGNRELALKVIGIYEMADPGNPEPNYMHATLLTASHESAEAVAQLKLAFAKGFSDRDRLERQPEFEGLKNTPVWFDLLKSLKTE